MLDFPPRKPLEAACFHPDPVEHLLFGEAPVIDDQIFRGLFYRDQHRRIVFRRAYQFHMITYHVQKVPGPFSD